VSEGGAAIVGESVARPVVPFALRFPPAVYRAAKQAADEAGLSLNAWIVAIIRERLGLEAEQEGRRDA
jgi:predicted HicB family RNase H-like nuclease